MDTVDLIRDDRDAASRHRLEYASPALEWNDGLPLGNGRLGAMVLAGARDVRLQINDDTCWSGSPESNGLEPLPAGEARRAIAEARAAALDGDLGRAGDALRAVQHRHSQSYLPFADLGVEVASPRGGRDEHDVDPVLVCRSLDLRTATHHAEQRAGDVVVTHRTWVSAPDQVLVHELDSSSPVDVRLTLSTRLLLRRRQVDAAGPTMELRMRMPSDVAPPHDDHIADPIVYDDDATALHGAIHLSASSDARTASEVDGDLQLLGVTQLTVRLSTATTFTGLGAMPDDSLDRLERARERVEAAAAIDVDELRRRQELDHRRLYDRVDLQLAAHAPSSDVRDRLHAINRRDDAAIARDPALAALLFHYGRYLLICSSRPGSLPANLQGIWNDAMRPPWSSNYTTNINVQMNYWPVDVANLSELVEPYLELVEAVAARGAATADRLYGLPGWVAHHNTDAWAYTEPVGHGRHQPKWAFWPLAGLWLARQYADSGAFTGHAFDERALPVLRSAAEFALGWLVSRPDGSLGTAPSTSPENDLLTHDGLVAEVAVSSTIDLTLIREHLATLADVADRLGIIADPVVEAARAAAARIPRPPIGSNGRILEWPNVMAHPDPHHRHLSPLLFLHPGTEPVDDDEADAAIAFLDARGDESTGWSLAWKMTLRARLRQPEHVDDLLRLMFRDMRTDRGPWVGGLYDNLLAAHPPFQIDGNLGYVAAIAECMIQSHRDEIELLPAWPRTLGPGRVRGLVARPGIEIDLEWDLADDAAHVTAATFAARHAGAGGRRRVRVGERTCEIDIPAVGSIALGQDELARLDGRS